MRRSRLEGVRCALGIALALAALGAAPARGDEYVIGADDVLQVSVWMHPELERTATVGSDGNITFPPIGPVKASGQTTSQLAARLQDRLSSYLRQTATVTVNVAQYVSRSVFVSGAVTKPGRYGFENLPSVLDVINSAGGATPGADLSAVQIIRREGATLKPQTVDVAGAIARGDLGGLPALRPGDTIVVPGAVGAAGAPPAGSPGEAAAVLGEVNKPGLYPVGQALDLWKVLAQAGGTTSRANLGDVRVVSRRRESSQVLVVNLRAQLAHGGSESFDVHPGDVVFVNGPGAWTRAWGGVSGLLALSQYALNVVVLVDYINTHHK